MPASARIVARERPGIFPGKAKEKVGAGSKMLGSLGVGRAGANTFAMADDDNAAGSHVTPDARERMGIPTVSKHPVSKRRRWLWGIGVGWGVFLLAAGLYAIADGEATVKEQRTITQAQPVVDRATEAVVAAAGPVAGVVIGRYESRDSCRISAIRLGADYQRAVQFYVRPGTEQQLLETMRAGLPKSYRAALIGRGASGGALFADAGEFIRVIGTVAGTGQVKVTASTGCRPVGEGAVEPRGEPEKAPVAAVFGTLGVEPEEWGVYVAGCVRTTVGKASGVAPGPLSARFEGTERIIDTDNLVVFRDGLATVAVTATGGSVTVARTDRVCQ
jgi:hypothetical protein